MLSVSRSEQHEATPPAIALSVVTTAYNEVENVFPFLRETCQAIERLGVNAEVVYIDDGSRDGTGDRVMAFAREHPNLTLHLVRQPACMGITAAIQRSLALAKGEYVCFLPADLESSPARDIPTLFEAMTEQVDGVCGWRRGRKDGKLLASRGYNLLNRWLFGVKLHDTNWIKLVRREKLEGLQLRSHWHRFLVPILVQQGCRFVEVETPWHRRTYGRSKFGLGRFHVSLLDLLTVKFLCSYRDRPLVAFGWTTALLTMLGGGFFGLAFSIDSTSTRVWMTMLILSAGCWIAALVSLGMGLIAELLAHASGTPRR